MTDVSQSGDKPAASQGAPYWFPDTRTFIVGWMMISCFALLVILIFKPLGSDNPQLSTLLGAYFTVGFGGAIGWWMHSSKSSDDKNDTISKQLQKGP